MLLKSIKNLFQKELEPLYGANEVDSFFSMLLEHYLQIKQITLIIEPQYALSVEEEQPLFEALARLKLQEPIQYIVGEVEFHSLVFKVSPSTLIPRPETEDLVRWIIEDYHDIHQKFKLLDIGTGSGCIAISLAKSLPTSEVVALDVSAEAIAVAKENASSNHVEIEFIETDILSDSASLNFKKESLDLIVSNPPYVRQMEKQAMKPNVLEHEPHLALFVENDDALLFYKAIAQFAMIHLKSNSPIYFEINQYLREEMFQLMRSLGYVSVEIRKDIFGNDRMLKALKA